MADGATMPVSGLRSTGLVSTSTSHTRRVRIEAVATISKAEAHGRRLAKMKQNVITTGRLHVQESTKGGFRGKWAMLTLTYRDSERWCAKQISGLLTHIRNYAARCGFVARYTWVLELTQRGRPHYHVLIWLPKGRTLPKPDKQGWWSAGQSRIEWARNAVGYLAKYASKGFDLDQASQIPGGARLSGFGGLSKNGRIELRWWKCPKWLRAIWNEIPNVGRTLGGYVNRDTGEFLASPWRVVFFGGTLNLCKVHP